MHAWIPSFWTIVTVIELVWVVALSVWVVSERRSPVATIAWIFALVLLPVVGAFVYFFVGPRRLERRKKRRRLAQEAVKKIMEQLEPVDGHSHVGQLAWLAIRAGEAPPLRAHSLDVITSGDVLYDRLVESIDGAKHHVHVEFYIYENDHSGKKIRDALTRAAMRGIEVRLLLDWIGSYSLSDAYFADLEKAGGHVAYFNPVSWTRFRPRFANFRTHRKLVIVDGTEAFLGGMNVSDCHSEKASGAKAWRDTHFQFRGDAVRATQQIFFEDWQYASEDAPKGHLYFPPLTKDQGMREGETFLQIVSSGPDHDGYAIHKWMFAAIGQAEKRVWLSTPYFVPDEATLTALISAALRGVDVRVLLPSSSDSALVDFAARSYFPELLRAGVRLYTYEGRMMHSKTLVIDDDAALIGTANFDNRSFRLNFEIAAAIYNDVSQQGLQEDFLRDLDASKEVSLADYEKRGRWAHIRESGARLFSPLL